MAHIEHLPVDKLSIRIIKVDLYRVYCDCAAYTTSSNVSPFVAFIAIENSEVIRAERLSTTNGVI